MFNLNRNFMKPNNYCSQIARESAGLVMSQMGRKTPG